MLVIKDNNKTVRSASLKFNNFLEELDNRAGRMKEDIVKHIAIKVTAIKKQRPTTPNRQEHLSTPRNPETGAGSRGR